MKKYEIFASEGGYRVCGGVWGDSPVIDNSPWFATYREAKQEVEAMKARAFESDVNDCLLGYIPDSFFSEEVRQRAEELRKEFAANH